MDRRLTGILGERKVATKYIDKKYKILDTNYKSRFGEIDVIASKNNTVVFIEVKTRKNDKFAAAKEFVTYSKQQKIKATASLFLQQYKLNDYFVRFDVAEVYTNNDDFTINIIENAFE